MSALPSTAASRASCLVRVRARVRVRVRVSVRAGVRVRVRFRVIGLNPNLISRKSAMKGSTEMAKMSWYLVGA